MNKEIANKWAAALRSGDYPQGTGALCDGKSFCCLGVLVEQFRIEFPGVIQRKDDEVEKNTAVYRINQGDRTTNHTGILPDIVSTWAGMFSAVGVFNEALDYDRLNYGLISLNDDGLPFNQIADLIDNFSELL